MGRTRGYRGLGLSVALLFLMLTASVGFTSRGSVLAQYEERDYSFGLSAMLCDHDPGVVPMRDAQFPPDGCRLEGGIRLSLVTTEGQPVGRCMTAISGWCRIDTDFGELYVLQVQPDTIPAGYVAQTNPKLVRVTATGGTTVLVREDAIVEHPDAAKVTLHSRVCPIDYAGSDWFNDCHGAVPAYPQAIVLSGPTVRSAWVDEQGNAFFENLEAGDWAIVPALPDATASYFAFCARTAEPGIEFASTTSKVWETDPKSYLTFLTLEPGDDILCDLYVVPTDPIVETAQVTFHIRNCSEHIPIERVYEECHAQGSSHWFAVYDLDGGALDLEGYLDDEGNVTLELPPGRYGTYPVYGHNVVGRYVFCSQDGRPETGVEEFPYVSAGESWTCDVYYFRTTFRGA